VSYLSQQIEQVFDLGQLVVNFSIELIVKGRITMAIKTKKPLAAALGVAFLASTVAPVVSAGVNPFAATSLTSGYDLANFGKHGEGKCGEGKCGGDKADKEGKCGEGKCGAEKKAAKEGKCGEGKCGAEKKAKAAKEGKCGEGKCGAEKKAAKEGKCGEGKCGGDK
jgi:uncharacterized low-complexity protein